MIHNAIQRKMYRLAPGESRKLVADAAVMSQAEVAAILGITEQAVQQIERKALYKIRLRMADYREELEGLSL